ncbi:preprotein translocase subunit Sec61beta [Candidatus Pacearchaeota archaeon]|nr:preprotein translocase subunit Sec61beta [Candidatus Pacearchaeota archaeon]MBD3283801.1 preprotein translocase subunit Sec61beta [Candidatus Pacearchaeota archaeon]
MVFMAGLGNIAMPSGSGGLMRYNEEYKSFLRLKPAHVILFLIVIVAAVAVLKIFFPIG